MIILGPILEIFPKHLPYSIHFNEVGVKDYISAVWNEELMNNLKKNFNVKP